MQIHFEHALSSLQTRLSALAATVEGAVDTAVCAVTSFDCESARKVVDDDAAVDHEEILIEEECLKLLALYQPVASDLRLVITVLKINGEVERAGDLAVNIADRVPDLARLSRQHFERVDFSRMAALARKMFTSALDSFAYHDVKCAEEVLRMDNQLDEIHHGHYAQFLALMKQYPEAGQYYLDYLTISRALERLGDLATNIAEDVIYLETGRIVRHTLSEENKDNNAQLPHPHR